MSDPISYSDTIVFKSRDSGWYEDDPDYYYEGSIGKAYVKLAVPKIPGRYTGSVKVTITMEPVEEQRHSWIQLDNTNDICSSCGEVAYGNASYGGVNYPSTPCMGDGS